MQVVVQGMVTEEKSAEVTSGCRNGYIEAQDHSDADVLTDILEKEMGFTGGHREGRCGNKLIIKVFKEEGQVSPYILIIAPAA